MTTKTQLLTYVELFDKYQVIYMDSVEKLKENLKQESYWKTRNESAFPGILPQTLIKIEVFLRDKLIKTTLFRLESKVILMSGKLKIVKGLKGKTVLARLPPSSSGYIFIITWSTCNGITGQSIPGYTERILYVDCLYSWHVLC